MLFNVAYSFLRIILFPFFRLRVNGRENMPDGGALVCANHTSLIDPIFVAFALGRKRPYAFMAKVELFKNPVLRVIMKGVGAFPVSRGKADVMAVKTAIRSLRSGKTLIIFPEGTRVSADEEESAEVKSGAGMLAVRGGVPVVPVYVSGNQRLFGSVSVTIGKPFQMKADPTQNYREIAGEIMQKVFSLSKTASR